MDFLIILAQRAPESKTGAQVIMFLVLIIFVVIAILDVNLIKKRVHNPDNSVKARKKSLKDVTIFRIVEILLLFMLLILQLIILIHTIFIAVTIGAIGLIILSIYIENQFIKQSNT